MSAVRGEPVGPLPLDYATYLGLNLNIPESDAAVGASVSRAISSLLSGQADPLLIAAECADEDDIPIRMKQAEIAAFMAKIPGFGGSWNQRPEW